MHILVGDDQTTKVKLSYHSERALYRLAIVV